MTDLDILHQDPELDARLKVMRAKYEPVDPRYSAEDGFFVLATKGKYQVMVAPLMYTAALTIGLPGALSYLDRWCYHTIEDAIRAGDAWDGGWPESEPEGWHRHPASGRRSEGGDPSKEEVWM